MKFMNTAYLSSGYPDKNESEIAKEMTHEMSKKYLRPNKIESIIILRFFHPEFTLLCVLLRLQNYDKV